MKKFKVGDRVVVVKCMEGYKLCGSVPYEEFTINHFSANGEIAFPDPEDHQTGAYLEHLELKEVLDSRVLRLFK